MRQAEGCRRSDADRTHAKARRTNERDHCHGWIPAYPITPRIRVGGGLCQSSTSSRRTRAESDAFVDRIEARFEAHGFGLWALEVRETGQFIGFTGLAPLQEDVPGAGGTEIGWRLARHAWHHGYATEAALAARDVAFTGAGLPELWSMTAVLNTPSQAVMRRIGMTEAARFEHPRVPDGSPLKPHVVYHLASPC